MRVVVLLLVLAVIGVTLAQWLGSRSSPPVPGQEPSMSDRLPPPAVPTRPQELKGFENDMNRFMQDSAKRQARKLESQEK